jgi:undecaprenyl-diphosphatase
MVLALFHARNMAMRVLWRRYGVILLCLLGIAAVSAGGLALRASAADIGLLRAINSGLASPALDGLAYLGYALGTFWFSLALFAGLFFAGYRRFGLSAVGAMVAGGLLVLLIKYLSQQPRPWQMLAGVRFMGLRAQSPAFPSGHAQQAFLTTSLLNRYFLFRWYIEAVLYSVAALVAFTRIYVGDHFACDVIAGALIGVLVALLWTHTRLWPGTVRQEERR